MSADDDRYGAVQIGKSALVDIGTAWTSVIRLVLPGVEFEPVSSGLRVLAKKADWYIDVVAGDPVLGDVWNLVTQQVIDAVPIVLRREDGRDAAADVGVHRLSGPANVALLWREPIGRANWFRLVVDRSSNPIWA